ncbi:MAG: AAA family ATPase [Chloroflexota bacterium]|nr:AAA family ATPase [Chloroflexota bacterium]
MPTLEGILERITYHSEQDGYTVARVQPRGKDHLVTIVGKLLGMQVGESLELEGRWVDHPEHGRQFEVERYRTVLPATVEGIKRYLGSGLIKGVGPVMAKRIAETFGAYTLEVIDNQPLRLREVPGLGPKRVERIMRAWEEQQQIKAIMLFLQEHEIAPGLAVRIYKHYGEQSLSIVQATPYRLADDIYGIGFLTADRIAQALGIPHDSPQRVGAGLRYTLSQATDEGHCFLPWDALLTRGAALLEVDPPIVAAILEAIAITREVHVEQWDGQRLVYLQPFYRAERAIAERILDMLRAPSRIAPFYRGANWPRVFDFLADERGIALSEQQQEAVRMALTNKVSVLTGGPGTGKCVRGDTLVSTEHGLIRIAELMPAAMEPDTVIPIDINVYTRQGRKKATHFYYGGKQQTLNLITSEGYSIEGTPNHRIIAATSGGTQWQRLDQVQEGDFIAIFRGAPQSEFVFDSFAYFLGLFVGDGYAARSANKPITGVVITSADTEVWEFLEGDLPKMNFTVNYWKNSGQARDYYIGRYRRNGAGGVANVMRDWGCRLVKSTEKNVPDAILRGNLSQKRSFLMGLFDSDGTADKRDGTIELGMSNYSVLKTVQIMLLDFGIISILKEKPNVSSWRLTCRGAEARLFYQRIGFKIERKQVRCKNLSNAPNTNIDLVPCLDTGLFRSYIAQTGQHDRRWWWKWKREVKGERKPHRDRVLALLDLNNIGSLEEGIIQVLCNPRIYWARVASVEQSEAKVYDLHVPDGHEFIANGLINHNTTTLRTIIMALAQRGEKFLLASPTGRAAKRLSEATEAEAMTIHRLLEFTPVGGPHFKRNAEYPLDAALVIVDEVSMLDVLLANNLLKALPQDAHLLLVGDSDQLPSVGPGRVLHDIIDSMAVPSIHLTTIFRQAEGSGIITNAHRINSGEQPRLRELDDFFFFPRPEPEPCAELVVELVSQRIPRRFGLDPRRDVQVLTPTHRGPAGVANLNTLLQAALNPPAPDRAEQRFGATVFRLGDRVLQLRNNYDLDVYNGDIGEVIAIDAIDQLLTVRYDHERDVAYDFGLLDELTLAYAISIHKAQGAEYACVVIPLLTQHYTLLQRNLLYTGVTRAKRLVVLLGDRRAIAIAVKNNRVAARYTGLARRLKGD